jgi:hypothetical protein
MARRVEVIGGKEYVVTTLPKDPKLYPSAARERALWNRLTPGQKAAHIRTRKGKAKRRRRRRKSS